jgi:hypothetical protein
MEGLEPVREVFHDPDGDWQFLCGTTLETADLKLVCFGCMFDRDPSIGGLAALPPSWFATRQAPDYAWAQEEYEPRQDEA